MLDLREDRGEYLSAPSFAQDLDRILGSLDDGASGWLVANNGRVQKRIAFDGGAVVFAVSSDPKDRMGQALLRAGLIDEKELTQALLMPREPDAKTPHLTAALLAMHKVTAEQARAVFDQKLREAVLDLFVWTAGKLHVIAGPVGAEAAFPSRIPLATLRSEGEKRRARWAVVRAQFPTFDVAFERKADWPSGFPATAGDHVLARKIESGQTLAQILLELHGQDYAIGVRIASLFQKGVLARKPAGGFVPESAPAAEAPGDAFSNELSSALLNRARSFLGERKFAEARSVLTELIENDPLAAADAWELMVAVEEGIIATAEANGLTANATLTLAEPITAFAGRIFPADQAFVLSRFAAGRMTVGELRALCPIPPTEIFQILQRFLDEKIIKRV